MGPIDPQLLAVSAPVRRWIVLAGVLTTLNSAATIALGLIIGATTAMVLGESAPPWLTSIAQLTGAHPASTNAPGPQWPLFATIALGATAVKIACSWALATTVKQPEPQRRQRCAPKPFRRWHTKTPEMLILPPGAGYLPWGLMAWRSTSHNSSPAWSPLF